MCREGGLAGGVTIRYVQHGQLVVAVVVVVKEECFYYGLFRCCIFAYTQHTFCTKYETMHALYIGTNIDRGFTYNVHLMRHVCSLLVEHHLMQCTNKLPSVGVPVERGEGMCHYKSQLKINSLCNFV